MCIAYKSTQINILLTADFVNNLQYMHKSLKLQMYVYINIYVYTFAKPKCDNCFVEFSACQFYYENIYTTKCWKINMCVYMLNHICRYVCVNKIIINIHKLFSVLCTFNASIIAVFLPRTHIR